MRWWWMRTSQRAGRSHWSMEKLSLESPSSRSRSSRGSWNSTTRSPLHSALSTWNRRKQLCSACRSGLQTRSWLTTSMAKPSQRRRKRARCIISIINCLRLSSQIDIRCLLISRKFSKARKNTIGRKKGASRGLKGRRHEISWQLWASSGTTWNSRWINWSRRRSWLRVRGVHTTRDTKILCHQRTWDLLSPRSPTRIHLRTQDSRTQTLAKAKDLSNLFYLPWTKVCYLPPPQRQKMVVSSVAATWTRA